MRAQTRVVVAMSGGVDSSVTAALVKALGYDTIGITLQLYDDGAAKGKQGACCAGQDIRDARAVAARLDIPHYVLDYESRFREAVIDRFADSYASGETPIPCVQCNEHVKFADLLETAKGLGAAALVTGHYIASRQGAEGHRELHRAADADRDQSYFLFSTTQEQLDFLRFPLGGLDKTETRALAERLGLAVAQKPDSQDICFVPSGRYADIVRKLRPEAVAPGDIVDLDGRVLGTHDGIINYTIGQRRGLKIALGEPVYVVSLDRRHNRVIVGPREALLAHEVRLSRVNWLGDGAFADIGADGVPLLCKLRSSGVLHRARLVPDASGEGRAFVHLEEGEAGVSPGQACVFYEEGGTRVLGGGWITSAPTAYARAQQGAERRVAATG